jgi:hypothetical protein
METLLAQADPSVAADLAAGFFELLAKHGPSGAFFAIVGFLTWKYGPQIIEAHLSFVRNTDKTQGQIADSLTTLTETHAVEVAGHKATHKAQGHIAEGLRKMTDDPEAKVHFDRAMDVLE